MPRNCIVLPTLAAAAVFGMIRCGGDSSGNGADGSSELFEGDEPGECSDDADNDRDGLFDCADPGCAGAPYCRGGADADGEAEADAGADADGDGDADADVDGAADVCMPDCAGRECGDDGCGGSCPPDDCDFGQTCDRDGHCIWSGVCDRSGFWGDYTTVVRYEAPTDGWLTLKYESSDYLFEALWVELYAGYGDPEPTFAPGSFVLGATAAERNYQTCGTCIVAGTTCTASDGCEKMFFATAGTLAITDIGSAGGRFAGTLTGLELMEVTIDPDTLRSTPVPGGAQWCIDSTAFDGTIAAPAPACEGGYFDAAANLCWENPPRVGYAYGGMSWDDAVTYCDALSLGGYGPGSWHLPTVSELRSLLRGCPSTETGGACGVTDACLDVTACSSDACWAGCDIFGGPGPRAAYWPPGVTGDVEFYDARFYWSSSPATGWGEPAVWAVAFDTADVGFLSTAPGSISEFQLRRCVRPGP
ncbi:MAG: DUF1566 domain-containing protein [Deltaproteobacteria bacterium]|nr:DUF1566 domain-containing protein [Deltaproteobacteria bacterium]